MLLLTLFYLVYFLCSIYAGDYALTVHPFLKISENTNATAYSLGKIVNISQFPYMVSIHHKNDPHYTCGRCEGTIITAVHVLSLASCIINSISLQTGVIKTDDLSDYYVRVLSSYCFAGGFTVEVDLAYMHPIFFVDPNAIVVLELKKLISPIRIVTLPQPEDVGSDRKIDQLIEEGATCQLIGWSSSTKLGKWLQIEDGDLLKSIDVTIFDNLEECPQAKPTRYGKKILCGKLMGNSVIPFLVTPGSPLMCNDKQYGMAFWSSGCLTTSEIIVFTLLPTELVWVRKSVLEKPNDMINSAAKINFNFILLSINFVFKYL